MKRIALLTVLLLVVGLSLGFAQEFKPSIAWSTAGTATLTWGINLDTMETGFTNGGSAQFTLTLVPAVTLAKSAEAPVYGWIQLTTTALTITDTAALASGATAVAAKIVATPLEIGVNTAPSIALGKVTPIENAADAVLEASEAALATSITGAGTYVKYVSAPITFEVDLLSIGDWTRAKDTQINYAVGAQATLVFAPVTIGFGAGQSLITGSTPIAFATVALAMAPLTIGFQMDLNLAATMAYDAGFSVAMAIGDGSLGVTGVYGNNFNGLDLKVAFASGTLVPNLTESLTVYVLDIGAVAPITMEYEVINTISYKVALSDTTYVTPTATVTYGLNYETNDTILKLTAGAGMGLFPNTTITVTYTSGDLIAPPAMLIGTLTFAFGIAY